mgnify:CR=1 FL=1
MKKLILSAITAVLLSSSYVAADVAVGLTATMANVQIDGTETLRNSNKRSNGNNGETVLFPEIFVEVYNDQGAMGIAYIPVQEMGSKSRTDANVGEGDNGTYKAEAELKNHIMFYADLNVVQILGQQFFVKGGLSMASIDTKENLNGGSSYDGDDVYGLTGGLGFKADIGENLYYKVEGTYTEYADYNASSSAGNKIDAETDIFAGKVSLAYKF